MLAGSGADAGLLSSLPPALRNDSEQDAAVGIVAIHIQRFVAHTTYEPLTTMPLVPFEDPSVVAVSVTDCSLCVASDPDAAMIKPKPGRCAEPA